MFSATIALGSITYRTIVRHDPSKAIFERDANDWTTTMLLRETSDGFLAISQPTHAWISGLLLNHWGNAAFASPAPAQEVRLAAALHDIGWFERDLSPRYDERTGLPQVFADVPATEHTQLWRAGVAHAGVASRYAAILISMHGDTIYAKTFDPKTARPEARVAVEDFLLDQRRFREREITVLRANSDMSAAATEAQLAINKALIAAVDTMSLTLCFGGAEPVTIRDVPSLSGETVAITLTPLSPDQFGVDPWPFQSNDMCLRLEGRLISRRCTDEEEFAMVAATAPFRVLTLRLRPST